MERSFKINRTSFSRGVEDVVKMKPVIDAVKAMAGALKSSSSSGKMMETRKVVATAKKYSK